MKKTVKSLIIAASVAAIAGIGAVSFAAWSGGTTNKSYENNTTSHRSTVEFVMNTDGDTTHTTSALDKKLVPYDQTDVQSDETAIYHIKLEVAGNDIAQYKLYGRYSATKTGNDSWNWATGTGNGGIKYLIDQSATTGYVASGEGANATSWTSWTKASDTTNADLGYTTTLSAGSYYVHIVLVSESSNDMDVGLDFHFELVKPAS